MTRDRLDELFQHCADIGVEVEWADLGPRRRGEYQWWRRTIVLSTRMVDRTIPIALAHELAHAIFDDRETTALCERRAWEWAAAYLVTPSSYRRAEWVVGSEPRLLAAELEVNVHIIEAWRRWWEKRGHKLDAVTLEDPWLGVEEDDDTTAHA